MHKYTLLRKPIISKEAATSYDSFGQAFSEKIFWKSTNQKQELPVAAMFVNGSGRDEHSFGKAVSEEKIFKNRPIRNKNCLWRPCLLTDRN
jgi:hypothetical protein